MAKKTCAPGKWIPCALQKHKEGSLHRQLLVPKSQVIPTPLLEKITEKKIGEKFVRKGHSITVTTLLKRRAVLALTLRGFH